MKKIIAPTLILLSFLLFSCGGGSGGSSNGNSNAYIGNPTTPQKTTATITGKIGNLNSIQSQNLYITAVSINQFGLPVRKMAKVNSDGSFSLTLDKGKKYAFLLENDKNEYLTAVKNSNQIVALQIDNDTNLNLSYNGSFIDLLNNNVKISIDTVFNKDADNDGIPFIVDFTEVNNYFTYKLYFDNFTQSSMSFKDIGYNKWSWAYMHYKSNLISLKSALNPNLVSDFAYFMRNSFCVDVERKINPTKQDRLINGKIFRRIEGFVPIYIDVNDGKDELVVRQLKKAINNWNNAFKEIGIDNKIELYYAGEVVENKYFYNGINNDWRGIVVRSAYDSKTLTSGETIENSFVNDVDKSFKLSDVEIAILYPSSSMPFSKWKSIVDSLMKIYPDLFYVEYKYDKNGNPIDYGALITHIGKPMKAIILNSYYKSYMDNTFTHEIGHTLGFFHPFDFERFSNYPYIPDLKGKLSVMNYDDGNTDYPSSYNISQFDKDVLKYIYNFSTSEEITRNNVSQFLKTKCGL